MLQFRQARVHKRVYAVGYVPVLAYPRQYTQLNPTIPECVNP